ncbi:MAG: sigma-70 family RNA polymerase sigma factor [Muribaculaceae bacterium]
MVWADKIFEDFRKGRIEGFYTHVYPDILVYATSLLHGELAMRAEDFVQDAVEASYRRREEFRSAGEWKSFMIACIRNRIISWKRHCDARENYVANLDDDVVVTTDALHDYIEVETRIRLYNAIATLPEQLRQVFALSFEEGLRNSEIAARLGVAEITVKKRKARLIERLRILIGDDAGFWIVAFIIGH